MRSYLRMRKSLSALLFAVLVGACTTSSEDAWVELSPSDALIELRMPDMEPEADSFSRKSTGFQSFIELGAWKGSQGAWPRAELALQRLSGTGDLYFSSADLGSLAEQIADLFAPERVELGAIREFDSGRGRYQRFMLEGDLQCVFMRQFRGGNSTSQTLIQGKALGRAALSGWYCEGPHSALDEQTVAEFVQSAGTRGSF